MNSADPIHRIQPEVRAAISAFLNEAQRDPKPFALSEALAAVRQVFPELEISDADLADAITSEALTAGVDIEFDVLKTRKAARTEGDRATGEMPTLPLAVGIADAISEADAPLDIEAKAAELLEAHPEAEASREDIKEVLESESDAAAKPKG